MKAKKGEAAVVGVHDSGKAAHVMGGHLDKKKQMVSAPASGSKIPAHKVAAPDMGGPAQNAYAKLNHNEDTHPTAYHRADDSGDCCGLGVIMPSGE